MHISSISLVADDDERYACKKDSDGWVWVYFGDISLLVKPQHVEHLVHLRDALNEILEGVPVPEADDIYPKCTNGHDRCYEGPSEDCPYCEQVPLILDTGVYE